MIHSSASKNGDSRITNFTSPTTQRKKASTICAAIDLNEQIPCLNSDTFSSIISRQNIPMVAVLPPPIGSPPNVPTTESHFSSSPRKATRFGTTTST